jgi:MerR family mercuric resistance operon transcriptional regulator
MQPVTDKREAPLSIGALSQRTGVHIETIRYYERVKMLGAPPRTAGGRRVYSESHRRTLGFIRRARDLGFNLDEIRALLDLDGSGRASCAEVREIASRHLANVRAKLADLARLEAVLSKTVGQCAANFTSVCSVLDILDTEREIDADGGFAARPVNSPPKTLLPYRRPSRATTTT